MRGGITAGMEETTYEGRLVASLASLNLLLA